MQVFFVARGRHFLPLNLRRVHVLDELLLRIIVRVRPGWNLVGDKPRNLMLQIVDANIQTNSFWQETGSGPWQDL